MDVSMLESLRSALREHEIGKGTPYRLCFARKGKSGASFGYMQGDLAAGQDEVRTTFADCLRAYRKEPFTSDETRRLLKVLSVHCPVNPLTTEETERVNDALVAGAALVDRMDETIFGKVLASLDRCVARASDAGRLITPEGLLYMALWIKHDRAADRAAPVDRGRSPAPGQGAGASAW